MTTPRTRAKRKPAQDNGQEMTTEQAQAFLEVQIQKELQEFSVELEKFLVQKNFQLIAVPFIDDDGRIRAQIQGIPRQNASG